MKIAKLTFNLNTIFAIVAFILLLIVVSSFFNKSTAGNQISLSEFVTNIKADKYAVLDIKDDGTAVAQGKMFLVAPNQTAISLQPRSDTKLVAQKDMTLIDANQLYEMIRP